ncbi:MAG: hypothetical protein MK010_03000 [Erythrobacter sp.]|nr:hypothetical protein [Erythrobacter sp.]
MMTKKNYDRIVGGLALACFLVAVMAAFGYTVGKDIALRENAAEAAAAE